MCRMVAWGAPSGPPTRERAADDARAGRRQAGHATPDVVQQGGRLTGPVGAADARHADGGMVVAEDGLDGLATAIRNVCGTTSYG